MSPPEIWNTGPTPVALLPIQLSTPNPRAIEPRPRAVLPIALFSEAARSPPPGSPAGLVQTHQTPADSAGKRGLATPGRNRHKPFGASSLPQLHGRPRGNSQTLRPKSMRTTCSIALCLVLLSGSTMRSSLAGDPDRPQATPASASPVGPRSHIQTVAELASNSRQPPATGLVTSRASDVLREQLALDRGCGLVVEAVAPGTPAARAGLKRHDVLVSLDGQLLLLPEQLAELLECSRSDAPLQFEVRRAGQTSTISLHAEGTEGTTSPTRSTAATDSEPVAVPPPAVPQQEAEMAVVADGSTAPPPNHARSIVTRLADDTLVQHGADYWLKIHRGEELWLIVRDPRGWVVFNGVIDTPAQRSLIPIQVRSRVEQLETMLASPAYHPPADPQAGLPEVSQEGPVSSVGPGSSTPAGAPQTPAKASPGTDVHRSKPRAGLKSAALHRPAGTAESTRSEAAQQPPAALKAAPLPAAEIGLLDVAPIEIR